MEENKAIFTKVGSTNADIMHYDELRFDVTIPANTTSGEIRPDTLAVTVLNNDSLTPVKQNGKLQIQNNSDSPQTGIVSVRGRITDIILDGIANWVTDVYGHKNSIKIRAPYLTKFSLPRNPKTVKLNLADLLVLKKLEVLQIGNTSVTGDISSLASLTKLSYLNIINTSVTGDISSLASLTMLSYLDIYQSPSVTGDISSLASLTKLGTLGLGNTSVTGDISSLASLTKLTYLGLSGTSVTGDISSLASLTMLGTLGLSGTNVTGDISSLASLTKLTYLNITNTSVTGDVQVCIDNMPLLKTLKIPKTVTITDEQKKTLTDRGCTITIL